MDLVKPSYGIVVIDNQANTLLVQQYGKSWCPPKGRMEDEDHDNPILTASRELREETGYVSSLKGGEKVITAGMPNPRINITYVKDHAKSGKDRHGSEYYRVMSTTITRPTFMGKPEPGWFGPEREFTYFLGICEDLHKVDFSGVRDKAITDMKIVSMDMGSWADSGIPLLMLHGEDFKAIYRLYHMAAKQQRKALKDAKNN